MKQLPVITSCLRCPRAGKELPSATCLLESSDADKGNEPKESADAATLCSKKWKGNSGHKIGFYEQWKVGRPWLCTVWTTRKGFQTKA